MSRETPFGQFTLYGEEILLAAIALHEVNFTDADDEHQRLCGRIRKAVKKRMPSAYEQHLKMYDIESEAAELEQRAKQIRSEQSDG